ncbi:MAG: type II toxin-antitoxin system RelE/ParE family toxin [Oscillospiraceae bacterium]|nr:type II toxin-antitoxin system RelE/ParE family toxin [Oscillospiraceae bacterium]
MVPEKYSLKFVRRASRDLDETVEYISRVLENEIAAANLIQDISDALDLVMYNPEMCPLVRSNKVKRTDIRRLQVKKYLIFYRADHKSKEIKVYRVIYAKRKYEDLL